MRKGKGSAASNHAPPWAGSARQRGAPGTLPIFTATLCPREHRRFDTDGGRADNSAQLGKWDKRGFQKEISFSYVEVLLGD